MGMWSSGGQPTPDAKPMKLGGRNTTRVAIVGGLWDKPSFYQERMVFAPEQVLASALEEAGLAVHRFGHLSAFRPADFDVVHVHCPSRGVLRVLEDGSGARFVYTNHASRPEGFRSAYLTWAAMRTADCVVALSNAERERIRHRHGVAPERSTVIANGIDASVFRFSEPSPPQDGHWRLLFVGQLIPLKAPDTLLDALSALRSAYDMRLEFVYQNAAMEADLKRKAERLGLAEDVTFTGLLRPEGVAARMREAHVLVVPSLAEELPAVVTQAMLCGRQVVATDVGSTREQLDAFGIVVAPGSHQALAEGIARALSTFPDFCAGPARWAHEAALGRFSIPAMVEAHVKAYRKVLDRPGPSRRAAQGRQVALGARLAERAYRLFARRDRVV